MTIVAIALLDKKNPVEVQVWLDAHPQATVAQATIQDDIFYILYT